MKRLVDSSVTFNRSKIYESLTILPEPAGYKKPISWIAQNQIAATNGNHYVDRIGKLNSYPMYELPVPKVDGNELMLDIGSGWGRWLIAGYHKGYIPIGMDLRLEFCEAQQKITKDNGILAYSVVGDLDSLPFQDCTFDLIWSFSVLQHTHRDRLLHCLHGIDQILCPSGYTKLEFPNKNGIRNRTQTKLINNTDQQEFNSWCVRYYTIPEYKEMLTPFLKDIQVSNHSMIGIGVLKEDLKYVSFKNKILCAASLGLSGLTKLFPGLTSLADSIYITANKKSHGLPNEKIIDFVKQHLTMPFDNLNVVKILTCPQSGESVILSEDRKKVIVPRTGIYYPIYNNIPVMIPSECVSV